jgi:hypothetical protein
MRHLGQVAIAGLFLKLDNLERYARARAEVAHLDTSSVYSAGPALAVACMGSRAKPVAVPRECSRTGMVTAADILSVGNGQPVIDQVTMLFGGEGAHTTSVKQLGQAADCDSGHGAQ